MTRTMKSSLKSSGFLLLAAIIWGNGFVAQRLGMEHIGPFLFSGLRLVMGAATVYAFICLRERRFSALVPKVRDALRDATLRGGIVCGVALFTAGSLQQVGLVYTSASKGGFLTALYIVIVPVLGLFIRQRTHWNTWIAIAIAVPGLYLLCVTDTFEVSPGDILVVGGALFWAVHILATGHFVGKADVFRLSTIQLSTAAILSLLVTPFLDPIFGIGSPDFAVALTEIWAAFPAMAFAGVVSSGIAFTCQSLGQRDAPPAVAALIMSLEAMFATIGGFVILHESFTLREGVGCALMFTAILLAQLPLRKLPG